MNDKSLDAQITYETAKIRWRELQRFFASGTAIAVDAQLDLVAVAAVLARDDATQLRQWMEAGKVDTVTDQQAQCWYEDDALVWAVVIKPWVLVQSVR